jgi:probable rRNA maturation factor
MGAAQEEVTAPQAHPPKTLSLSVQYACGGDDLPTRSQIRRWLAAACEPGLALVTVRFVDAAEGRALNAAYRGKDYATNVLSFPYALAPALEGDLVVCSAVVRREAEEQGVAPKAHFAHLIVHGMLHLQGYDHENDHDAAVMESRERAILVRLGFADPYANEG